MNKIPAHAISNNKRQLAQVRIPSMVTDAYLAVQKGDKPNALKFTKEIQEIHRKSGLLSKAAEYYKKQGASLDSEHKSLLDLAKQVNEILGNVLLSLKSNLENLK